MREYIDVTGRTEEEAIRKALEQLGKDRDEVSVEILERAKAGFLGIGRADAKVRISYGEEEIPRREERGSEPNAGRRSGKPEQRSQRGPERKAQKFGQRAEKTEQRAGQRPERAEQKAERPAQKPESAEQRPERAEQKGEKPAQKSETRQRRRERAPKRESAAPDGEVSPAPVQELGEEVDDEKAQAIKGFLTGLLRRLDCEAAIKVYQPEKGRYKVILEGRGMGALIGRRGETLDAIQQLTGYAVNRTGNRVRVQLDAEGYREKREQSLQHLARKVAAKVIKYRRSQSLEPMNAYERHVIHTALQGYPGVTTYSTGMDPNRRVIVAFDRGEKNQQTERED